MFNNKKIQRNKAKPQQVTQYFKPSQGAFAMAVIGIK